MMRLALFEDPDYDTRKDVGGIRNSSLREFTSAASDDFFVDPGQVDGV
jgi:hypothetical protein